MFSKFANGGLALCTSKVLSGILRMLAVGFPDRLSTAMAHFEVLANSVLSILVQASQQDGSKAAETGKEMQLKNDSFVRWMASKRHC